jgi:hypothetical protein
LSHHNIGWLLRPGQTGIDRPFQAVVMQGGSFEPLTAGTRKIFVDTAVNSAEKVRAVGGKPFLYMTHVYVSPHRRAKLGMINRINDTYSHAGREAKPEVIPVGLAFERSYEKRPNFPFTWSLTVHTQTFLGRFWAPMSRFLHCTVTRWVRWTTIILEESAQRGRIPATDCEGNGC